MSTDQGLMADGTKLPPLVLGVAEFAQKCHPEWTWARCLAESWRINTKPAPVRFVERLQ